MSMLDALQGRRRLAVLGAGGATLSALVAGGVVLLGGTGEPAAGPGSPGAALILRRPTPTPTPTPTGASVPAGLGAPGRDIFRDPLAPVPSPSVGSGPTGGAAAAPSPSATMTAATTLRIGGHLLAADTASALAGVITGVPGSQGGYTAAQRTKAASMTSKLAGGTTYSCPKGAGGDWDHLVAGAQAVVSDAQDSILAVTKLTGGTLSSSGCSFTWAADVAASDFYRLTVEGVGPTVYPRAEVQKGS